MSKDATQSRASLVIGIVLLAIALPVTGWAAIWTLIGAVPLRGHDPDLLHDGFWWAIAGVPGIFGVILLIAGAALVIGYIARSGKRAA